MKKIISLLLVVALTLSLSKTAAASSDSDYQSEISEEEIQIARESYYSLNHEAKVIFEEALQSNYEMLVFHVTYVDPAYKLNNACVNGDKLIPYCLMRDNGLSQVRMDYAGAVSSLSSQLAALDLPTSVLYSLNAMGAAMVAAVADGPLPIGDILLAAATASVVIVVAVNWNSVAPKWSQIVAAFKRSFANSVNNITSAFNTIKGDVDTELIENPCVTVSGTTITINAVAYKCTTDASAVAKTMEEKKHKYYPAVLSNNMVLVCPKNIDRNVAIAIMSMNRRFYGVFALKGAYARDLCSRLGEVRGPETHDSLEGYWYHYHASNYPLAHCWFFI